MWTSTWWQQALIVGSGGFLGSVARYFLGGAVHRWTAVGSFPVGTLAVNVLGCLLIGILGGASESARWWSAELRLFLQVGLLGGFTTFSAFGYESLMLWRELDHVRAFVNIGLQVTLGLAAAGLGWMLIRPPT